MIRTMISLSMHPIGRQQQHNENHATAIRRAAPAIKMGYLVQSGIAVSAETVMKQIWSRRHHNCEAFIGTRFKLHKYVLSHERQDTNGNPAKFWRLDHSCFSDEFPLHALAFYGLGRRP